ncbi:hypothetical protein BZL30_1901 [Mycobacterium kansasii]|uniref:Uncharacterized protein n=1 Tax=Mycobacterium kansasii TaxID=1768 RepID=A0A1V3XJE3_MYCKA|nr:hypothetical protein BZL30_1901 [Mycobacterium kansasii]
MLGAAVHPAGTPIEGQGGDSRPEQPEAGYPSGPVLRVRSNGTASGERSTEIP